MFFYRIDFMLDGTRFDSSNLVEHFGVSKHNYRMISYPYPTEKALNKSDRFLFFADAFTTYEEAEISRVHAEESLSIAMAHERIGFKILNSTVEDSSGMLLPFHVEGYATTYRQFFKFKDSIMSFLEQNNLPVPQYSLAFSIFHSSLFQQDIYAKFILLVISIESIISKHIGPSKETERIKIIADKINELNAFNNEDRLYLIDLLGRKKNMSILSCGKIISKYLLEGNVYFYKPKDKSVYPDKFFEHCYTIRSNIAHGKKNFPKYDDICEVVVTLEEFVRDILLSEKLISIPNLSEDRLDPK